VQWKGRFLERTAIFIRGYITKDLSWTQRHSINRTQTLLKQPVTFRYVYHDDPWLIYSLYELFRTFGRIVRISIAEICLRVLSEERIKRAGIFQGLTGH
jgi:hypothetical protein